MAERDSGGSSGLYECDAPSHVVNLKDLEDADSVDTWFGWIAIERRGFLWIITITDVETAGLNFPNTEQQTGEADQLKTPSRPEWPFVRSDMADLPRAIITSQVKQCSSEEQELECIRNLQKEVALHRKKNEASYKAALAGRPSPVKGDHLKLTQPHTPNPMTRTRSRPPVTKSSADLEAEELDKLHKFKIKALELNKKILESAEDLKKPAVKEPSVPQGFELQIEKRLQGRQAPKKPQEDEEKLHTFKSQPLPKNILEGVVVKRPSPIKRSPVPHFGLPFQPRLSENHHLEVCPFSFEERERERRVLREKRLEEKQNKEVPQLLPEFDMVVLPDKKKLEPTKPKPFRLLIDERGSSRSSRWEQMLKEEQKRQEEAAVFKARPNTVTHKEPFQPKKEERAAVATEAFELTTERRAREWQEYERAASEKALRALMEEEQREKEEIARLRQERVHKAQPIRHYKPVAVKKSKIPLTVPQSPNISD